MMMNDDVDVGDDVDDAAADDEFDVPDDDDVDVMMLLMI